MFESLFSHRSPDGRAHDHLFTPYAPDGGTAHQLSALFYRYASALPDEPPPPQHKHYRALVLEMIHRAGGHSPPTERLNAAYITCFERDDVYQDQLRIWRADDAFCTRLGEVRFDVIADLLALERTEAARRTYFSRWRECVAEPIDLRGETLLDLIMQMTPDDWHQIACHWDWNDGVAELEWITAQRGCDRATALYVYCAGWPGDIAMGKARPHAPFIREIAARLEGGFYPEAVFGTTLTVRQRMAFRQQLDMAWATGVSPWRIPPTLLDYDGFRAHAPTYAVTNRRAHYQYAYWLEHRAPPLR